MLVWTTEMPLRHGSTVDDVVRLTRKWLTGSPHATWTEALIPPFADGEVQVASQGGESVSTALLKRGQESWGGLRYVRPEADSEWTTEIVAHHDPLRLLVTVQVHCELGGATPSAPKPRKPYIIRQLLDSIGGGSDGGLPITDTPLMLKEADIDLATKIVRGEFRNHLPIVYASATWKNTPAIEAVKLAQWAAGLAHVVVEPSRVFSHVLARNTNRENVYGGSLGIYWPKHDGMRAVLHPESFSSPARLSSAAADLVRRALLNCRTTESCTWDFIKESMSRDRLERLRASGSQELNEYMQAFDDEIDSKNQHIDKLEKEASRLRIELQKYQARAEAARSGLLTQGKEKPFYPGEIRDAVLKALVAGKNQLMQEGRCRHIVDDILTHNHLSKAESEISERIRSILTTCENLGREQQKNLEQLGFEFSDDGKHIQATYHEDPRYSFTMPRTGSDWRGMKNQASDIVKALFK